MEKNPEFNFVKISVYLEKNSSLFWKKKSRIFLSVEIFHTYDVRHTNHFSNIDNFWSKPLISSWRDHAIGMNPPPEPPVKAEPNPMKVHGLSLKK